MTDDKIIELAKECGATLANDGILIISADELKAYTELVSQGLVEALEQSLKGTLLDNLNRDEDSLYRIHHRMTNCVDKRDFLTHINALNEALTAHRELIGEQE